MFMNEYDVMAATSRFRDHPTLGPATRTLSNLMEWTNRSSDGWCYWRKPSNASRKLQELIGAAQDSARRSPEDLDDGTYTAAAVKRSYSPIKAFRTRQGADFAIEVPA